MLAALALVLPATSSADALGSVTLFKEGLRPAPWIFMDAAGPDGNVWFVDANVAAGIPAIGKITPSGTITEYVKGENLSGLNEGSDLIAITAGPKGEKYLWFTDRGTTPAIGRIDSASPTTATEYSTGLKEGSKPAGIVAGPDGNLWFADNGTTPAIGVINPSTQEIKECSAGLNEGSVPHGIAAGPDGNLWFTDNGTTPAIGRINPSTCEIKEFSTGANTVPGGGTGSYGPWGITAGADGNVWYTEGGTTEVGKAICRITPTGTITCFKTGLGFVATSKANGLTAAPNGKLWFTDSSGITEQQTIAFSGAVAGEEFEICDGAKCAKFKYVNVSSLSTRTSLKNAIKAAYEAVYGAGTIGTLSSPATSCGGNCSFTVPFSEEGSLVSTNVGQASCSPGGKCSTGTSKEGVPNAVGCVTTSGEACGETTRYPINGIFDANGIAYSEGSLWLASGFNTVQKIVEFGCEEVEGNKCDKEKSKKPTNLRTLTVTKSAGGTEGIGTVQSKPKGIKCGPACNSAVAEMYENETVVLKAKASTGSTIASWSGCESSTGVGGAEGTCTVKMTEDQEVEVAWSGTSKAIVNPQALTVSKGESSGKGTVKGTGGLGCETECTETTVLYQGETGVEPKIKPGKTVVLKAASAFGSEFTGFSPNCTEITPTECSVVMNEAEEVTAEFAAKPTTTLTVDKAGTGTGTVSSKPKAINCGATCTTQDATVPEEEAVILKEKPGTGMTFEGWTGACVGAGETCTVTLSEAGTVTAKFGGAPKAILNPQELTLEKGGSGYGTVKAAGLTCEALCTSTISLYQGETGVEPKIKPGKTVILKAISAPGSKQVVWSGCTEINPTECSVVMNSDTTVTATFDELE